MDIEITKLDATMMLNELTRYEIKLHQEHALLAIDIDSRNWLGRKRMMYLRREMRRVGQAIYSMTLEYDLEWRSGHELN